MDSAASSASAKGKNNNNSQQPQQRRASEDSSGLTSPRPEAITPTTNEPTTPVNPVIGGRRPSVSQGGKGAKAASNSAVNLSASLAASSKNVSLFAHLPQFDCSAIYATGSSASISSHLLRNSRDALIHPAIIKLGLAYADYSILGASERCRQMLLAFKQVGILLKRALLIFRFSWIMKLLQIKPLVDI